MSTQFTFEYMHTKRTSTTHKRAKRRREAKKDHFRFKYVNGSLETGVIPFIATAKEEAHTHTQEKLRFHIEKRLLKLGAAFQLYN